MCEIVINKLFDAYKIKFGYNINYIMLIYVYK